MVHDLKCVWDPKCFGQANLLSWSVDGLASGQFPVRVMSDAQHIFSREGSTGIVHDIHQKLWVHQTASLSLKRALWYVHELM